MTNPLGHVHAREGIESFWSFTKRRLARFNGTKKNLHLHLNLLGDVPSPARQRECEWRWGKTLMESSRNSRNCRPRSPTHNILTKS